MNEKIKGVIFKAAVIVFIALMLLFFGQVDVMKIGLILGVILILLVVTNMQLAIIALIIVAFTFSFLANANIIPGKMLYVYDMLIYLLFLFSLINGKKKVHPIEIYALLYISFIVISFILGKESFPLRIKGFVIYIKYPILFLTLLRLNIDTKVFKYLIKIIIFFSILQVFTSIFQFIKGNSPDWCGGFLTRYASGSNAILMTMMFLLILGWIMVDKLRIKYVFMSIFFMIPLVLSSARAGFIFFIVSIIFMFLIYIFHIKYYSTHAIMLTVIGIVILLILFYFMLLYIVPVFEPKSADTISLISSPDLITKDMTGRYSTGYLRRWTSVIFAYNYLTTDILKIIVGNGPGTVAISGNFGLSQFMREFGSMFYSTVSLPTFLLELGVGGITIIMLIFFYVIFFSLNRAIYIEDKFLRVIGFALPGISLIMILASIYTNVWNQEALQLVYWLFVASIIEPAEKAVKKDKILAVLFLKEIPVNEKATVHSLIQTLYLNEIRTLYVIGKENDTNMLWLMNNKKRFEDLKIKWIKIYGYESMNKQDILNILINKLNSDVLILDGSDMTYDSQILQRFIKTDKNVFSLKNTDSECDYCIVKIRKENILKFSYFIKGRDPDASGDPIIEFFNSKEGIETGFVNWSFLLEKDQENQEKRW